MAVAPGDQQLGFFSLLVAFGICHSHLEEGFVAHTLSAVWVVLRSLFMSVWLRIGFSLLGFFQGYWL